MQVQTHQRLQHFQTTPATSVVIRDNYGNIIAIAVEVAANVIVAETMDSPNFPALLQTMGLAAQSRPQALQLRPLSEIALNA